VIPDGPRAFKKSVVKWTKFRSFELQTMFACLREREEILLKDYEKARAAKAELWLIDTKARLEEVRRSLIWMAHNVTGSRAEIARRRRGDGAGGEFLEEELIENSDSRRILRALLRQTCLTE